MQKFIAVDIETIGLSPFGGTIWMISVCGADLKPKVYHDCNGMKSCPKELITILQDKTICKVVHNGEFDLPYIELNWGIRIRNVWDTMVAEKNIQGVTADDRKVSEAFNIVHSASLKYTLTRYGLPVPDKSVRENFIRRKKNLPFTKDEIKYAGDDVRSLLPLRKAQEYLLTRDKLLECALLDNKVVEKISRMRVIGIGVDKQKWLEVADANLNEYKRAVAMLPKSVANWGSNQQVKYYFKQKYGIVIDTYKNLKKIYLETRNPMLGLFIKTQMLYSDATGYGKTWLYRDDGTCYIDSDGRVRPSYDQNKNTGRFSTSNPNVLGFPRKGKQRSCIVPKKGNVFVIGDFAGQEIAIMAAAAKEDFWIDALLRGEDIHGLMASIISSERWMQAKQPGCTFPKKCKCPGHIAQRMPAKESNFLLAYGGGVDQLLSRIIKGIFEKGIPTENDIALVMSRLDAQKFIHKHKRALRKLVRYLDINGRDAIKTGVSYSADPYRRRRMLQGQEDWQIRNQGMNNPIQSAGANCLKLAVASMPDEYDIILPFHDEIVCEVPKAKAKSCFKAMVKIMEDSADYITGIHGLIKADVKIQTDYAKY